MGGPYEFRSLPEAGGMGEVYLAHDTGLDRPVGLNLPSAGISGAHAAHIHEIREAAVEYVEGDSLAQRLAAWSFRPGGRAWASSGLEQLLPV